MNSPLPPPDDSSQLPPPVPAPGFEPPPIPAVPLSTEPFQTSQSSFASPAAFPTEHSAVLATPWIRLGAVIVDQLIAYIPVYILNLLTGGNISPFLFSLLVCATYLGLNWKHLASGQTVAKKFLNLKIVMADGSAIDRLHLVKFRIGPVWLASLLTGIPVLGLLAVFALIADALCIFRPGHKTLHDELAKTKVVQL